MSSFVEADVTLESSWRAIILFGRNVASYKFALAHSLIELADRDDEFVSLEELAEPFSRYISGHLQDVEKQGTSGSSRFLEACRAFNGGSLSKSDLVDATVKLGFANVIDAFHVVHQGEVGPRFFVDERKAARKGIRVTEELGRLRSSAQWLNLPSEVEARWRLVEAAWELNLPSSVLTVRHDPVLQVLVPNGRHYRRPAITGTRHALNGYQKGKCFYCSADISVADGSGVLADVDHFFPHKLHPFGVAHPINGVWNLVLACASCNRGAGGKFDRVPTRRLLERLWLRNTFLIDSHHPLRETLMAQTGQTASARRAFFQRAYDQSRALLIHTWEPSHALEPAF